MYGFLFSTIQLCGVAKFLSQNLSANCWWLVNKVLHEPPTEKMGNKFHASIKPRWLSDKCYTKAGVPNNSAQDHGDAGLLVNLHSPRASDLNQSKTASSNRLQSHLFKQTSGSKNTFCHCPVITK